MHCFHSLFTFLIEYKWENKMIIKTSQLTHVDDCSPSPSWGCVSLLLHLPWSLSNYSLYFIHQPQYTCVFISIKHCVCWLNSFFLTSFFQIIFQFFSIFSKKRRTNFERILPRKFSKNIFLQNFVLFKFHR